jgi:hypothetical protein
MTFNNRLDEDLTALEEYRRFRLEAESKGFCHFLEVFDPNAPFNLGPDEIPRFVNDSIARALAGVAKAGRPLFLKVVYHGPKAMEELVAYDPHLVVGILGGGSGTTYDAFKLIAEAQKYGARVALFGRKINNAECQLAFVEFLRLIVDGAISPEEAVRAYHAVLGKLNLRPHRSLTDDMTLQTGVMSYGGTTQVVVPAGVPTTAKSAPEKSCGCHTTEKPGAAHSKCHCDSTAHTSQPAAASVASSSTTPASAGSTAAPDFSRMTQAEKLAYNRERRNKIFG